MTVFHCAISAIFSAGWQKMLIIYLWRLKGYGSISVTQPLLGQLLNPLAFKTHFASGTLFRRENIPPTRASRPDLSQSLFGQVINKVD